MLNKKIKEKVLKIMELGLEISNKTNNKVFVRYYGHTDALDIDIYYNGWTREKEADLKENLFLDFEEKEVSESLDRVIKKLEELKGE